MTIARGAYDDVYKAIRSELEKRDGSFPVSKQKTRENLTEPDFSGLIHAICAALDQASNLRVSRVRRGG